MITRPCPVCHGKGRLPLKIGLIITTFWGSLVSVLKQDDCACGVCDGQGVVLNADG